VREIAWRYDDEVEKKHAPHANAQSCMVSTFLSNGLESSIAKKSGFIHPLRLRCYPSFSQRGTWRFETKAGRLLLDPLRECKKTKG
jgi:hypothetical protein